jgi:hypothetical protein
VRWSPAPQVGGEHGDHPWLAARHRPTERPDQHVVAALSLIASCLTRCDWKRSDDMWTEAPALPVNRHSPRSRQPAPVVDSTTGGLLVGAPVECHGTKSLPLN